MSLFLATVLAGMYVKLKIKPLRKNNIHWNITNEYEFNRFILNFVLTFVFMIDGFSFISLLISAVLEIIIRKKSTGYYQK